MNRLIEITNLERKADYIRKRVVDVAVKNMAGHIAPSLSIIDVLTVLYYNVMNISDIPGWEQRDRLVFSKAHGAYGLYAILADIGYIKSVDWEKFYKGSFLSGCIERSLEHGIEAGCGALGHGLPMAVGIAFGARIKKKTYKSYCIVGDGEMQEGSNWEAVQFAVKYKLDNLIIIIDCNGLQAMDHLTDVLSYKNHIDELELKLDAFGAKIVRCDGHNISKIIESLANNSGSNSKPLVVLAKTVKGYGIKAIENIAKFHFRIPTEDELNMGKRYE